MRHFFLRELMHAVNGPRFIMLLFMSTTLIITSLLAGYLRYDEELRWHVRADAESFNTLSEQGSYRVMQVLGAKATRAPGRLGILVSGVDGAVGRAANATPSAHLLLRDSRTELNPVYALLGELDYALVVKMILSLFALLFSFNAVCGERENGTLRLILTNPVSRASIIFGTFLGNLVVFVAAVFVPTGIGLVLIELGFGVSFSGDEWIRIVLILGVSVLYLCLFYLLGFLASSITRSSVVSFAICLLFWVVFVAVIPRVSLFAADAANPVLSLEEVEMQLAEARREKWRMEVELKDRYAKQVLEAALGKKAASPREVLDPAYKRAQREAQDAYLVRESQVMQELRRGEKLNQGAAISITRLSPVSCFSLAASRLAATDAGLRARFLTQLERYRGEFQRYIQAQIDSSDEWVPEGVGYSLSTWQEDNGEEKWELETVGPTKKMDVSGAPHFVMSEETLQEVLPEIAPDIALLILEIIITFALAFWFFSRYDAR